MVARATWGSTNLGGTIGLLSAGARLRVAYWRGPADGPGTVVLVQGRSEFIECYGETIADLIARGFSVVTFDLRGQGGSEKKSRGGHIDTFRQYGEDIAAVVRFAAQLGMVRPFTVVGHSMGGLASLLAQPLLTQDVEKMVLIAPMLQIAELPAPRALVGLYAGAMTTIGLGRKPATKPGPPASPDRFGENRVTSDSVRYGRLCHLIAANPELTTGPPTFGWVHAALKAMRTASRLKGKPLSIPTLFVACTADRVVSTAAIDGFARATPGAGVVLLRGARHQIFSERDELRDLVFTALEAFLEERVPQTRQPRGTRGGRQQKFTIGSQDDPIALMTGWRIDEFDAVVEETFAADPDDADAPLDPTFEVETPWLGDLEGDADILEKVAGEKDAAPTEPDDTAAETDADEGSRSDDGAAMGDGPDETAPAPVTAKVTDDAAVVPTPVGTRRRLRLAPDESAEADAPALRRRRHPGKPHAGEAPAVPAPATTPQEDEAHSAAFAQREPMLPPDRRTGGRWRRPR